MADYERHGFGFGLADSLGGFGTAVAAMKFLVCQFMGKRRKFLGGWLVR